MRGSFHTRPGASSFRDVVVSARSRRAMWIFYASAFARPENSAPFQPGLAGSGQVSPIRAGKSQLAASEETTRKIKQFGNKNYFIR